MKFKLNPAFTQASGALGDLVFRQVRGKTVASRKSAGRTAAPSENQVEHRERFKQAAAYGKSALANAETRAIYEEFAKSKNMPVFAVTIADFFNVPAIDFVDVSMYNGQAGSLINISARDEFGVARVSVAITDQSGNTIENGNAVETAAGSGHWVYTATATAAQGTNVTVNVVATDRPGGTAVSSINKSL